ncbi:TonB-dependent receptor [Granulicella tundricola]|uniref:TonB-dependent transporter Oar-like beta-barrel domain-containing protein n=1 Tax=Granulicella tundricola (strain ATCC BAA-1859 / DSM 23138 / MP5ACTX9) TaxID=1198114 RepID=E8WZX6_GRATM|nr:TonB-dependent receptor [Granulicella tundricola]ADW67787.1 hypothetical protein AciX9_0717 [Granulicella tundricola MP5ACTX9]
MSCVCGVLLGAVCAVAGGQQSVTEASLTGRVSDPAGALVAHAAVTAREVTTNILHTAETDGQGRFRFPYLPGGDYVVEVHGAGFAEVRREVRLTVGAGFDLAVGLRMASSASAVEVKDEGAVVETDSSQIAGMVSEAEAHDLPFNGRNFLDLAGLVAGVSGTNTASTQLLAETSSVPGQGISVNSQRNFSNSFVVDGLSANDDAAGLAGNAFGLDTIREFQVVTSGGQAEFGRAMGGYFNVVTRSGSNALRGSVYGFLRNQRLNSENALSRSTLPLTQAQYGASLGGPIMRDKTFYFLNFEKRNLNTDGVIAISPANAAAVNAKLVAVGYAAPLLAVSGGNSGTTLFPTTLHTTYGFGRVDHEFGPRDRVNARYTHYELSSINARGVGSLSAVSAGSSVFDTNDTLAVSNIATLSSRTFNETRAQFTRDSYAAPPNDEVGPAVSISGVASFGRLSASPTVRMNYLGEVVDNVVHQRGAHTLKGGVDFLMNDTTITFPQSLRGAYTFSSLANFLAGTYNSSGFTQSFGTPVVGQTNPNVGMYVQDEWKASAKLTVNAGVRYDLQFLKSIQTDKGNVSPRIGFAWAPARDGRTVVRGSFGLFYDRVALRALANALLSAGNSTDLTKATLLSYSVSPLSTGAPAFPAVLTAPPAGVKVSLATMNPNIQNAYAEQASLGVEQQISSKTTVEMSYQHLRGEHLLADLNKNVNYDGSYINSSYANNKQYDSVGDSYYDGLEVSVVQRPVRYGSLRASYVWSKAIDDVGEFFFSAPVNNFNLREDRGRSDDDQRHRVSFNATVHSSMDAAHDWRGRVTHGWMLSGVLQYQSRLPFNIVSGTTSTQFTALRPCLPGADATACKQGRSGTLIGRNTGVGFDFYSLNARLSRTFVLSDRLRVEGMAEAFNALNHRNDMIPNATAGASGFAGATAVGDPRSVQLGARISF